MTFLRKCFKLYKVLRYGPVAQLGERCVRIAEVKGSNPSRSTKKNGMCFRHMPLFFCALKATAKMQRRGNAQSIEALKGGRRSPQFRQIN